MAILYGKRGFTTKEKVSSNLPATSVNGKRIVTHVLCHSTRLFRNKPLVGLDWSLKSRKHYHRLSKYDQGKRIRGKTFFWKEYYFWDCTHNIFNFNKYFVCIIFLFVLLILQDQNLRNLCVQIFGTPYETSLPLISFVRRLISTTSMAPKRTQVMHINKGDD